MIKETNYLPTIGLGLKCKHKHSLKYKSDVDENCTLDDCCVTAQYIINIRQKQSSLDKRVISKNRFRLPIKYTEIQR